jgi:RimJ/RimL family protein N-acetyltransferase
VTAEARIRPLRPSDHAPLIAVIDEWLGGRPMAQLLPRLFFDAVRARHCTRVRAVTSPVNTGSIAFHRRMGFRLEPGDAYVGDIPVATGYDGPGQDRVRFVRDLPS